MSGALLALPVAAPLLAAGLLITAPGRYRWRRAIAAAAHLTVLACGGYLLARTLDGTVVSQRIGGWPTGIAIIFAADTLSALMLCLSAVLALAALAFAAATGDDAHPLFTPLSLVLVTGAYGALLTADLFNLFVFVEVMLVPSYALCTMVGGPDRVAAGRIYLAANLLASTFFLAGVAVVYGVTGRVDLGGLAGAARTDTTVALAAAVVLLALAAKASVVPLHGWLPRAYPVAPPAVTVLFSGLLTKVGVYAIFRVYAVLFAGTARYRWVIMAAALLTMVVGVLGAVGEQAMRSILSFHMVSQIGYLLLGLALFTPAGLTAAIFFLVQYVLVKAALLMCAGAVEATCGTGRLDRLDGLARRYPPLAIAFMTAALSLAGAPPLSGFVAKLSLVQAAATGRNYPALATAVAVSLITLISMIKIWSTAFWGTALPPTEDPARPATTPLRPALTTPALALAAPSIVLGIAAQPLLTIASAAATGLIDTSAYVQAVTR